MNQTEIYKLHQRAKDICLKYAQVFCEILGIERPQIDFVGIRNPDIFGIVNIDDYFFKMSDLCTVIGEYDHWLEKYLTNQNLAQEIKKWYYWTIDAGQGQNAPYINLEHWLMGARPTEAETSDEYKEMQKQNIEKARQATEQAKQDLFKAVEDEYHNKMSYHH